MERTVYMLGRNGYPGITQKCLPGREYVKTATIFVVDLAEERHCGQSQTPRDNNKKIQESFCAMCLDRFSSIWLRKKRQVCRRYGSLSTESILHSAFFFLGLLQDRFLFFFIILLCILLVYELPIESMILSQIALSRPFIIIISFFLSSSLLPTCLSSFSNTLHTAIGCCLY